MGSYFRNETVGRTLRLLPLADKGAIMEDPFQFGKWLGADMAKKGWIIKGKSRELLEHEARE